MKIMESKFVDAGNISIVDIKYLKKYGLENPKKFRFSIKHIPEGKYQIYIRSKGGRGDHYYSGIKLEEGDYYIGDLCYGIKDWDKFLDDTKYMEDIEGFVHKCDDGVYDILISEERE